MGQSVRTALRTNGRSLVACTILVVAQHPKLTANYLSYFTVKRFTRKQYFHCLLAS